jgi:hypothetical protein
VCNFIKGRRAPWVWHHTVPKHVGASHVMYEHCKLMLKCICWHRIINVRICKALHFANCISKYEILYKLRNTLKMEADFFFETFLTTTCVRLQGSG